MQTNTCLLFSVITYILFTGLTFGQTKDEKNPTLQELYGDFKPGQSQQLNSLANLGINLPDTQAEEWPAIRAKIYQRIIQHFGQGPAELTPIVNKFEEIERYQKFGLTHIKYRYHVVDDIWNEAVLVI